MKTSLTQIIYHALVISIGIVLLSTCAPKNTYTSSKPIIVYPSPPDTARIVYITSFSTSNDLLKKKSRFKEFVAGVESPTALIRPYGVALQDGKIFSCDLETEGLVVIDLEKNTFEQIIPRGMGKLKRPINCFVEDNIIYVADIERRQVVIFDSDINYLRHISGDESFSPVDVFVTSDKIWVADISGTINVYDKNVNDSLLFSFPDLERTAEGYLFQPTNIWVTADRVYVSDIGASQVKYYTLAGEYLGSVGSYGRNFGQFTRPKGVAVDVNNNIYVVDTAFENVQVFNDQSELLMFFGGTYEEPKTGGMWLPAKVIIDYDNVDVFNKYLNSKHKIEYLILVTNNYGPDKINIYGFIDQSLQ
jgi:DNA-binding beta-propeller fold protein YncE